MSKIIKELQKDWETYLEEFYEIRSKAPYPYEVSYPSFEKFMGWIENGKVGIIIGEEVF